MFDAPSVPDLDATMSGITARKICDSQNPDEKRVVTYVATMPRSILAEGNTHCMLARNAASSRAIPTSHMIRRIRQNPYIPDWTRRTKGMQGPPLSPEEAKRKTHNWLRMRDTVIAEVLNTVTDVPYSRGDVVSMTDGEIAQHLDRAENAPHKQDINRPLEPWLYMEWVVTATDWDNFFWQRVHEGAHPAFQRLAYLMAQHYFCGVPPEQKEWGAWHHPFITPADRDIAFYLNDAAYGYKNMGEVLAAVSTARCARISFSKHGEREGIIEDLQWPATHIWKNLSAGQPAHVSPSEHPCQADRGRHGKFDGWLQFRKIVPGENFVGYTLEHLNAYEDRNGIPRSVPSY